MTEQTKSFPTPAADRVRAAREQHDNDSALFRQRETDLLNQQMTAEQAIEAARAQNRWMNKSDITTKSKAVHILVRDHWLKSAQHTGFKALEREADMEGAIIRHIETARRRVDSVQADVVAHTENVFETKRLMEAVADLRLAVTHLTLWDQVARVIRSGEKEPVEALRLVADSVMKRFVSTHQHRVTSRSTSLFSNLHEDLDNEATAAWLETVNEIERNW